MAIRKKSRKCWQNKKIIGYDISSTGTSTQIYTIANLKVPVLYMVALFELKLNENSNHDEVVMYQNMLHACLNPFPFQVVSGNILFAFVTDFLRKKPWAIKRNTFSFIL